MPSDRQPHTLPEFASVEEERPARRREYDIQENEPDAALDASLGREYARRAPGAGRRAPGAGRRVEGAATRPFPKAPRSASGFARPQFAASTFRAP